MMNMSLSLTKRSNNAVQNIRALHVATAFKWAVTGMCMHSQVHGKAATTHLAIFHSNNKHYAAAT